LRRAEDAVVVDTTGLDTEAALAVALEVIRTRRSPPA
jgi:hypothetical protein